MDVVELSPGQWAVVGLGIYQPFDPDSPGFVPMSESRARSVAEDIEARTSSDQIDQRTGSFRQAA